MDLRKAAEYFKARWKSRTEPEWHEGAKERRNTRQRDAQGRFRSQKDVDDLTQKAIKGGSQTSKKWWFFGENGEKPHKTIDDTKISKERAAKRHAQEQAIIGKYLTQVLNILDDADAADPNSGVDDARKELLQLLRMPEVTPEDMLAFDRKLNELTDKSPTVKNQTQMAKSQMNASESDAWERVQRELAHLYELEQKGEKLEFSGKLADTTLGILEAFLGPAGPLLRIARDVYDEHKESFKALHEKFKQVPKMLKRRMESLKRGWRSAQNRFVRMFPKLSGAMGKFAEKLKDLGDKGSSHWSRLKGKGKWGKMAAIASNAWTFMNTGVGKAVTGLGALGIASLFGGHKDKDKKEDGDSLFSMKTITTLIDAAGAGLGKAFDSVRETIMSSWNKMVDWADAQFRSVSSLFDTAQIKSRIAKDYIEEKRDIIWDVISKWFGDVWDKIKSLVPESVKRALGWARQQAGRAVDAVKDTKVGRAVSGAASAVSRAVGNVVDRAGGDGREKVSVARPVDGSNVAMGQKGVKVVSGVDMGGLNHGLLQNFYAMVGEYYAATGRQVYVNSGARDSKQQAALYAADPSKAARPGYSMHEYGLAIDINSREANEMESMGLFAKYGFVRPIGSEPWHLEPVGIQGMKSAIRKGRADIDTQMATNKANGKDTEGAATQAPAPATATATATSAKPATASVLPPTLAAGAPTTTNTPMAQNATAAISTGTYPVAMSRGATASVEPVPPSSVQRVESNSRQITTPTAMPATTPDALPRKEQSSAVATSKIGFYIGDMGFLSMNLGIGA